MKTVSSLKTNSKIESPKTPGGISKALLTPCRRVGLSRNWKKRGPSPFVSPLSGSNELKSESLGVETPTRKRKQRNNEQAKQEINEENAQHSNEEAPGTTAECSIIETTPSKLISPLNKRQKTLLTTKLEESNNEVQMLSSLRHNETVSDEVIEDKVNVKNKVACNIDEDKVVTTPVRVKSKSRCKKLNVNAATESISKHDETKENINNPSEEIPNNSQPKVGKQKSPENLTKECIVVIQKKIFKKDLLKIKDYTKIKNKDVNPVSQALFDSDTDDVPLSAINIGVESKPEQSTLKKSMTIINLDDDDDDFTENPKIKVKNLEDKTTSTGGLASTNSVRKKSNKSNDVNKEKSVCIVSIPTTSQSSYDDDDDFVQERKTILIRKSYDKVFKPLKAKSTGSITQKDIDDLKTRIDMKKKILLAKTMTKDTAELRDLIKKWQKGCQDALIELTQLMRDKFPDKRNMDFSEILDTLKIPAALVGYDEENDCFGTPTDENIVLSKFDDI